MPAFCDEMVITIEEAGGHRYRIRQPATAPAFSSTHHDAAEPISATTTSGPQTLNSGVQTPDEPDLAGPVRVGVDVVRTTVASVPGGGPDYTATMVCSWCTGYLPTDADVALVGVLADHAAGVVHRERTIGKLTNAATARQVGVTLDGAQRIAAATGVLMALHHLTVPQARQLLDRASDRTHRSLQQVADTVLHTGSLTEPRQHHQTDTTTNKAKPVVE